MNLRQYQVESRGALDVEAVERALTAVWKETAAASESEGALLRSRAANLVVFVSDHSRLAETQESVIELANVHPCRALMLVGERSAGPSDIKVSVAASCRTRRSSRSRQLCCETITLSAGGAFVSELPSAAIPLLLPDLQSFLWWRDNLRSDDVVVKSLLEAVDRLVIDSADFQNPLEDFVALQRLVGPDAQNGTTLSDMNWERLTPWRMSLADFYDVPGYRNELDNIDVVEIDYVDSTAASNSVPAQPVLVAGWLASALGWQLKKAILINKNVLQFSKDDRTIDVLLNASPIDGVKPGRVIRVELKRSATAAKSFMVRRSKDGHYLESTAHVDSQPCPARRLPYKNRSTAELLSREMEILCVDEVYGQAIMLAGKIRGL